VSGMSKHYETPAAGKDNMFVVTDDERGSYRSRTKQPRRPLLRSSTNSWRTGTVWTAISSRTAAGALAIGNRVDGVKPSRGFESLPLRFSFYLQVNRGASGPTSEKTLLLQLFLSLFETRSSTRSPAGWKTSQSHSPDSERGVRQGRVEEPCQLTL
jgi:hypothetical protein